MKKKEKKGKGRKGSFLFLLSILLLRKVGKGTALQELLKKSFKLFCT